MTCRRTSTRRSSPSRFYNPGNEVRTPAVFRFCRHPGDESPRTRALGERDADSRAARTSDCRPRTETCRRDPAGGDSRLHLERSGAGRRSRFNPACRDGLERGGPRAADTKLQRPSRKSRSRKDDNPFDRILQERGTRHFVAALPRRCRARAVFSPRSRKTGAGAGGQGEVRGIRRCASNRPKEVASDSAHGGAPDAGQARSITGNSRTTRKPLA